MKGKTFCYACILFFLCVCISSCVSVNGKRVSLYKSNQSSSHASKKESKQRQQKNTAYDPDSPILTLVDFGVYQEGSLDTFESFSLHKPGIPVRIEDKVCVGFKVNVNIPHGSIEKLSLLLQTPGQIDPATGNVMKFRDWTTEAKKGSGLYSYGYCFDHDYEKVPGAYELSITASDGQRIVKTFTAE